MMKYIKINSGITIIASKGSNAAEYAEKRVKEFFQKVFQKENT